MSNEILTTEASLLTKLTTHVNETISSQERVNALNESYSKRMAAYTRAVMAAVFGLAVALLLNILKSRFSIIPDAVMTIAYIIIFSSVLIYGMFVMSDIYSREITDFDKLLLNPPNGVSKNIQKITQKKQELGDLDLLPGYCIGSDCCSGATAWDEEDSKCTDRCKAGTMIDTTNHKCTTCAAGKYSAAGSTLCSDCAAGTFSSAGASSCSEFCPANMYGDSTTKACTACSADKPYALEGSTSASACTATPPA
jgi:hypothetical protein